MITQQPASSISALPSSLLKIAEQLEGQRSLKPATLRQIILEAKVESKDLLPWADFDHPVEDSYGRKMIYKAGNYEIMTMSWLPGDFSGIHDHGHTQWGAVQVFGPAEHATFRLGEEGITTLARWQMKTGEVVGVSHSLIHQMGNPTDEPFLSLHVYGTIENEESITGEARVFDMVNQQIQRVDGGVFFALPESKVLALEPAAPAGFPTRLRYEVELVKRLAKMADTASHYRAAFQQASQHFLSSQHWAQLIDFLKSNTNTTGHFSNTILWKVLFQELKAAARLQTDLKDKTKKVDPFQEYAAIYDAVIGTPCMNSFMKNYLQELTGKMGGLSAKKILSLGCGTAIVEAFLINELKADYNRLLGIDISEGMIREAAKRIQAKKADLLTLHTDAEQWDIAYSGLNVFHYLPLGKMEIAIQKTAELLADEGYFLGDFITPDHIRWYPNVILSDDERVISLRNPKLIEVDGAMFQESEIFNLHDLGGEMAIHYAGKHRRFLPPMHRVRSYFEKYFGEVQLFDAYSLKEISDTADTCASTRYVVLAKK